MKWNKRLAKAIQKERAYQDQNGRIHIAPSAIGTCLRAIQYREKHIPEGPLSYYMVRGGLVHDVVEEMIRSANPINTKNVWQKIRKRQRSLPSEWQLPLNMIVPEYEKTFRDFLKNDKFGKRIVKAQKLWIETKMEIPLENLSLDLPFSDEILKKYVIVGIPDIYFKNTILEFKTGGMYNHYYLQGLIYEKMAQLEFKNSKIRNVIVQIKPKKVSLAMKGTNRWIKMRAEKEEQLRVELTLLIANYEKWAKDLKYQMPRTRTGNCYNCKYYASCFSGIKRRVFAMKYEMGKLARSLKKVILRKNRRKEEG